MVTFELPISPREELYGELQTTIKGPNCSADTSMRIITTNKKLIQGCSLFLAFFDIYVGYVRTVYSTCKRETGKIA